jgi:hypothetical protein
MAPSGPAAAARGGSVEALEFTARTDRDRPTVERLDDCSLSTPGPAGRDGMLLTMQRFCREGTAFGPLRRADAVREPSRVAKNTIPFVTSNPGPGFEVARLSEATFGDS